jgi:hypothetical protein
MGWEVLVIPIIGVAVWIISTLLRNAEDAKQVKPDGGKRPEKVTDLDRFLREVKRRQESEREEKRPRRVRREEDEEDRVERRQSQPRAIRRMPSEEEDIPTVLPVEAVPLAEPVSLVPVMRTVEAPPLPVMPADTSPASLPARPESRALVGLRELLCSREGIRKALILREVLGPPLARRSARN